MATILDVSSGTIGRIYILRSNKTDRVYIGSTIQTLNQRMNLHRTTFKKTLQGGGTKGCSSRHLLAYPDTRIELLETVVFHNRRELLEREAHHIKAHGTLAVNAQMPGRTWRELRETKKADYLSYQAKWRAAHPDYQAKWKAAHPDYMKAWRAAHPNYQREYRAKRKADLLDAVSGGALQPTVAA